MVAHAVEDEEAKKKRFKVGLCEVEVYRARALSRACPLTLAVLLRALLSLHQAKRAAHYNEFHRMKELMKNKQLLDDEDEDDD